MPWFYPYWTETIMKKVCRYLLQKCLGQFMEENLNLDQLHVELYNGTGSIRNVDLSAQALNELCESQGWCIEVISARIGLLTVNVPWNALMTENSNIKIDKLYIAIKPLARQTDGTTMLESMWSSMSNSMQLAQECLEKDDGETTNFPQSQKMEGIERFAQTIDNVLNRIQAILTDTEIRLEYILEGSDCGIALITKIANLEYKNEASGDPPDKLSASDENKSQQKSYLLSTYSTHHIKMDGITFYTEEFRIVNTNKNNQSNTDSNMISSAQYYSTISNLSDTDRFHLTESMKRSQTDKFGESYHNDNNNNDDDDDNDNNDEQYKIYNTEQILIGQVLNSQEIRIKMKQTEDIQGPKVQLEMQFGAINFFVSPRQLQLLVKLCNLFLDNTQNLSQDDDKSNLRQQQHQQYKEKLSDAEFQQNLKQRYNSMTGGIGYSQGWSSDPIADNILSTNQQLNVGTRLHCNTGSGAASGNYGMTDSNMSTYSSMTSSICSSASTQNTGRARRRGIIVSDPNADISHINIRIGSCCIILLHEDILVESSSEWPLSEQSVQQLKYLANEYFFKVTGVCSKHHLQLNLSPIIIEGEEQRNENGNLLKLSISVPRADFREILQNLSIPLIEFVRDDTPCNLPIRPEIAFTIKQTTHTLRGSSGRKFGIPKMEFNFTISPCLTEIDISILDRLNAILSLSPFKSTAKATEMLQKNNNIKNIEPIIDVTLETNVVDVRFRFPITDLRPIHDPERMPWWSRNVRPDYLSIKIDKLKIVYSTSNRIEVSVHEMNIYYCENDKCSKTHIGKVNSYVNTESKFSPAFIEYPRLIIELPTDATLAEHCKTSDDSNDGGRDNFDMSMPKQAEPTPFSSKRNCRESDTPHSKQQNENNSNPTSTSSSGRSGGGETLIIPGDEIEMNNFCQHATKTSKIQIKLFLPIVSFQLTSKHLYETIYNRINTDLLLWEPIGPKIRPTTSFQSQAQMANNLLNIGMTESIYVPFTMCKSDIQYDSSSATNSESDVDSDNIYYSTYGHKRSKRSTMPIIQKHHTSAISFQLNIGQGMLTMYAPVRDSQNRVIPGQLGEFVIRTNSTSIFSVNGYHGNDNLGYLCLQGDSFELYHCGMIPVPSNEPPLRLINCILPKHLLATIYNSPKNLTPNEMQVSTLRKALSLAVQIKSCPEQKIKRIRVAVGIQAATLRHNFMLTEHMWLTQLIDLFDVVDYPVAGYKSLGVITELHLHLWDCTIDYRPHYLPIRTVITLGTFMISSNIATASTGCTLRFIAEDCTLSLAPQKLASIHDDANSKSKAIEHKITVLPASELVCIVDLGLLEISLRMSEQATPSFPKFDLRAFINDVHIRTCSDSAASLASLITYIATEGDIIINNDEDNDDSVIQDHAEDEKSFCSDLLTTKTNVHNVPEITESQQQRVNSLMEEAMQESFNISQQSDDTIKNDQEGVDVFCFPDETFYKEKPWNNNENQEQEKASTKTTTKISTYRRSKSFPELNDNTNLKLLHQHFPSTNEILTNRNDEYFTNSYSIRTSNSHRGSVSDIDIVNNNDNDNDDDNNNNNNNNNIKLNNEKLDSDIQSICTVNSNIRNLDDMMMEPAIPQVATELGDTRKSKPSKIKKTNSDTDEDFCIIAGEEKPIFNNDIELNEDPIRIVDNHFSVPIGKDILRTPHGFPGAVIRYTLCEMTLTWHIYGGHDFPTEEEKQKLNEMKKSNVPVSNKRVPVMSKAYKMGVSYAAGDGSPNVTFGAGTKTSEKIPTTTTLTWKQKGGYNRNQDILMEMQLSKVRFSHETYPPNYQQVSRQVLLVSDLIIRDRLVISELKKFLYHPEDRSCPKQGPKHVIEIEAIHLRPDLHLTSQECCLRISVLELRFNIDQDSLLFIIKFFNDISDNSNSSDSVSTSSSKLTTSGTKIITGASTTGPSTLSSVPSSQASRAHSTPTHQPPVMMVDDMLTATREYHARKMVSENLMMLLDDEEKNSEVPENISESEDNLPIFFKCVEFSPDVKIRLDYHGKRVELSQGPIAGLLMGLGQLNCSVIKLKKIVHRNGILGINRLLNFLLQEWLRDIKLYQLPRLLGGIGPMHAFLQLFKGIIDLFWLPIEQYQKDGRIVRGLQLGAQSFTARTVLAALEITARLIHLLQITAETAYDLVSPGPSLRRIRYNRKGKRKRLHLPQDIREGVANAYQIVKEGFGDTAYQIAEVAAIEHDQKGYTGAVGAVIRQIPPTVVRPIVLVTQATTNVLGGIKNQLVPDARREAKEKWKDDDE